MKTIVNLRAYSVLFMLALVVTLPVIAADDLFQQVAASTDVSWLEKVAISLDEARKLAPNPSLINNARNLRITAFARLGELSTEESLAAIERIEAGADDGPSTPTTLPLGTWTHPCWHYGDMELKPEAAMTTPDGVTLVILRSGSLGCADLFLITDLTPNDPASWMRPVLLPIDNGWGMQQLTPSLKDQEILTLSFLREKTVGEETTLEKQQLALKLSEITRDGDKDGWTDIEEARLGLDPTKADTDGDGISDGRDSCPNFAPPKDDHNNQTEILQRALFAAFGLTDSNYLLLIGPKSHKVQLKGYRGPIIYVADPHAWLKKENGRPVTVNWEVAWYGDGAVVSIHDFEGPEAAGSQYIFLKRVNNRWVVTLHAFGPIA